MRRRPVIDRLSLLLTVGVPSLLLCFSLQASSQSFIFDNLATAGIFEEATDVVPCGGLGLDGSSGVGCGGFGVRRGIPRLLTRCPRLLGRCSCLREAEKPEDRIAGRPFILLRARFRHGGRHGCCESRGSGSLGMVGRK